MPKVSEAHRAARRRQILDAAGRCFVRDGFHATSMQDVFRESGLSAGAVYRYFPSKHAIVAEIAQEVLVELTAAFDEITGADAVPPLDEAMARVLAVAHRLTGPDGRGPIALQVWSESRRDPLLADLVATAYRTIGARFVQLVQAAQDAGQAPPGTDPEQLGPVLFGAMLGYILQRLLVGNVDPAGYGAGLRSLLASATAARP
jgi:AcrR family transcriptional regulator